MEGRVSRSPLTTFPTASPPRITPWDSLRRWPISPSTSSTRTTTGLEHVGHADRGRRMPEPSFAHRLASGEPATTSRRRRGRRAPTFAHARRAEWPPPGPHRDTERWEVADGRRVDLDGDRDVLPVVCVAL